MKVTVNACRKKRVKVDVNAVTSRRDVVRIPVKAVSGAVPEDYTEPAERADEDMRVPGSEQLDFSAVFSSAVFERAEAEPVDELPEVFVKPVRLLNKLADTRPEPEDLPPFFDTRDMTEEEEVKAYSDPAKLVGDGDNDSAAEENVTGRNADAQEQPAPAEKKQAPAESRAAKQPREDVYSTEELIAIIEEQQLDKQRRDKELAEQRKAREQERAERAQKERLEAGSRKPSREEVSRQEDTLFMWWSELDSRDSSAQSEPEQEEAFTQMQITEDIPARRKPRPAAPLVYGTDLPSVGDEDGSDSFAGETAAEEYAGDNGFAEEAAAEEYEGGDIGDIFDTDDDDDYAVLSDDLDDEYAEFGEGQFDDEDYEEDDEYYDDEDEEDEDTSVNVRYFDRDNAGERVEVERSAAVGQEVVVIDNESGKMKRICGIIKRGPSAVPAGAEPAQDKTDPDDGEA